MTNLQRITELLARERYARLWDDEHVAGAILAELGVDPKAEVVTDDEVHTAEAAAELAMAQAKAARELRDALASVVVTPEPAPARKSMRQTSVPAAMTSSDLEHG